MLQPHDRHFHPSSTSSTEVFGRICLVRVNRAQVADRAVQFGSMITSVHERFRLAESIQVQYRLIPSSGLCICAVI